MTDSSKNISSQPKSKAKNEWIIPVLGILATVLAAGLGAYLGTSGSFDLWEKQNSYEKQNVAKALSIEISSMKEEIDFYANGYKSDLMDRKLTPTTMLQPFYSDKGMYYSFQTKIATFKNPNLSSSLFIFYNDLIQAEYYRNIVSEKSKIIIENPNYQTRNTINPYDIDTSEFVNRYYRVNNNEAKMAVWEGIDPKLSDMDNKQIADGRLANINLKKYVVNASEMIPEILSELNDVNNL